MNSIKVKLLATILLLVFTLSFVSPAFAERLTDQIKNAQGDNIVDVADESGYAIVDTIRQLAVVGAIVFIIWAGIVFAGSGGNDRKISQAKTMLGVFLVCLILIFKAESIVVGLFKLLGIENYLN